MTKDRALELFRYVDDAVIRYGEEPNYTRDYLVYDEFYRIYTILWEILNDIIKEKNK